MALPSSIKTGLVTWSVAAIGTDGSDADRDPDLNPVPPVTVTFTPAAQKIVITEPEPKTIFLEAITARTNAAGVLVGPDGQPGVSLVASDNVFPQPVNFSYSVNVVGLRAPFQVGPIKIEAGKTLDLSLVIPIQTSLGVVTVPMRGLQGIQGKSAYQVAVEAGYKGTVEQWLASLVGGGTGTGGGTTGKSTYQLAVEGGYQGTVEQWLLSLKGEPGEDGAPGKSAYELAQDNGFLGTFGQWLTSLQGSPGQSAYELAVAEGFVGTPREWLDSLKGTGGTGTGTGTVGPQGPAGVGLGLNVKDPKFGAVGNDVAIDTAALKAAIAALPAAGGNIFFPAGTYRIDDELVVRNGIKFIGEGSTASVIHQVNTSKNGLTGVDVLYFVMDDMRIVGPSSGTGTGIRFSRTTQNATNWLDLKNVVVRNFGRHGISVSNAIVSKFDTVRAEYNGLNGFDIYGENGVIGTSTSFTATFADGNGQAGYNINTMGYMSFNAAAADNNRIGYDIVNCFGITFAGCGAEGNSLHAWRFSGDKGSMIIGGWVYKNNGTAILITGNSLGTTVMGTSETSPNSGALFFVDVTAGSKTSVMNLHNTKPNRFAAGSTQIINDIVGNSVFNGHVEVNGGLSINGFNVSTQRGARWYFSSPENVDYTDVVGMIAGDAFLYGGSRDIFRYNGAEWNYQGVFGPETLAPGKSAYQVALDAGFVGTQEQWLASLVGKSSTVPGPTGKSAYQLAVDGGFPGTQAQWLASLKSSAQEDPDNPGTYFVTDAPVVGGGTTGGTSSGPVTAENLPAGVCFIVTKVGTVWPDPPTTRVDIPVIAFGSEPGPNWTRPFLRWVLA